jgi:hypothetical protein
MNDYAYHVHHPLCGIGENEKLARSLWMVLQETCLCYAGALHHPTSSFPSAYVGGNPNSEWGWDLDVGVGRRDGWDDARKRQGKEVLTLTLETTPRISTSPS